MKTKGIKRTPQEWIELAQRRGGFKPTTPKPFLVPPQQRGGAAQQMEFTFDGPQAIEATKQTKRKTT